MSFTEKWQSQFQPIIDDLYVDYWGEGCDIHHIDQENSEQISLVLDYFGIDKMVEFDGMLFFIAQRIRQSYGSRALVPDFTLRYSRPNSDNEVEYQKLMKSTSSDFSVYPGIYSFGCMYQDESRGFYEFYLFDIDEVIELIKSENIHEKGPIETSEGQKMLAYDPMELKKRGACIYFWSEEKINSVTRQKELLSG